jgi:hypothetical protein
MVGGSSAATLVVKGSPLRKQKSKPRQRPRETPSREKREEGEGMIESVRQEVGNEGHQYQ